MLFKWELAQAVSCNWRLAHPVGWTQQEALREIGRYPCGHQHPGQDDVFEMGTACSKVPSDSSHICLHTFMAECSRPLRALLDSSVRKCILTLALCSLFMALALIPAASENVPGTTHQGSHGPGHLHASQPQAPPASLPRAHTAGSVARTGYFWGGRKILPRVHLCPPAAVCFLST